MNWVKLARMMQSGNNRRGTFSPAQDLVTTMSPLPGDGGAFQEEDFLQLLTWIFSLFVEVAPEEVEGRIFISLERILDYFSAQRCVLFRVQGAEKRVEVVQIAESELLRPLPSILEAGVQFPWLFEQVTAAGRIVHISDLEELPAEAAQDKISLAAVETSALLLIPIWEQGSVAYIISIGSSIRMEVSPSAQVTRLRLIGEIFASALRKKALEESEAEARRFERLIADISARLAGVWSEQIDAQINQALYEVLKFADVDQVGFLDIYPHQGQAFLNYLVHVDGIAPSSTTIDYASIFPWSYDVLVRQGRTLAYSNLDELPPEAALDRQAWVVTSVHSAFHIPFKVDGVVRYIFAMTTNTRRRSWPQHFFERLRVLGDVFVSALGRRSIFIALRSTQRFAQATLNALHRYVCVIDIDGNVVECSEAWQEIYALQGPAGRVNFFESYSALPGQSAEDAMRFAELVRSVLDRAAGEAVMESEYRIGENAGWIRSKVMLFNIDIKFYVVIIHADITADKQRAQELDSLRSQHWHGDRVTRTAVLIASLSHELSQPLTAILSNAQAGLRFLSRDLLDKQKYVDIFNDIVADNKRASDVIEALRVIMRRQATQRKPVDMAGVIADVSLLLHSELVYQQIEIETEAEPESMVYGDQAQLQQVILNLMINGIDAMRDKAGSERRFTLRVWRTPGDEIRVDVSDTGIGIVAVQQDKLFDAFWTTKPHGTGMGLAICRSIIESHDGRIWVDAGPGIGSTFQIALPAFHPGSAGQEQ